MRVLQIFNRYLHVGGEELAVRQISERLSSRHEVQDLWFESEDWARHEGGLRLLRQGLRMVRNPAALARVDREIDEFDPDVILLHNLMPVGSSALYPHLIRKSIPILQYIHNFRPYSVNGYCWAAGRLQPAGLRKNFLPEIMAGAWQDSRIRTAWYGLQLWGLHALGVFDRMDGWIAISRFMADTFTSAGIAADRIAVIQHSWKPVCDVTDSAGGAGDEPMFLFLGRLSEEKGIRVLLDAWRIHVDDGGQGRLMIAGGGPLAEEVARRCRSLPRAENCPFVSGEEKLQLLRDCAAMVVPSVWWEPLGLVTFEAYDFGKPVLAARAGGIVDNVIDRETGWLHKPGDVEELAAHLAEAATRSDLRTIYGENGRRLLADRTDDRWLDQFEEFVGPLVDAHRGSSKPFIGPTPTRSRQHLDKETRALAIVAYLADQNPKMGRSLGISRMTDVVLEAIAERDDVELEAVVSSSSIKGPAKSTAVTRLPWSTRSHLLRVATDNLHPVLGRPTRRADVWYFPKGFMPRLHWRCQPAVATIHDTIIQYYQDHYPKWRLEAEYSYWAGMLRNTLKNASALMTVSEHSKGQIEDFISRHGLPEREIHVTYEPCLYEAIPQPEDPAKADYVLHLGSKEPHKRTAWLIRNWVDWAKDRGRQAAIAPKLHIVGSIPDEVKSLARRSPSVVYLPFLEDGALVSQFTAAKALIFPSEVEGFGLPAIEAYYLGTPVCFHRGTSVEEVLSVGTRKGGFDLSEPDTLLDALEEVVSMDPQEVRECGLKLRECYSADRVVERMMEIFRKATEIPGTINN